MTNSVNTKLNIELNVELNPAIAQLDALDSIDIQAWQDWFQVWLNLLSPKVEITTTDYEASLLLTDDQEIQALNRQYRFQDRPTDVLAFAALEANVPNFAMNLEPVYLGDIVISVPTAINQALEQGHSINWEIVWLAAHGFLHLLGWDHQDAETLATMLREQDLLLEAIAIDKH